MLKWRLKSYKTCKVPSQGYKSSRQLLGKETAELTVGRTGNPKDVALRNQNYHPHFLSRLSYCPLFCKQSCTDGPISNTSKLNGLTKAALGASVFLVCHQCSNCSKWMFLHLYRKRHKSMVYQTEDISLPNFFSSVPLLPSENLNYLCLCICVVQINSANRQLTTIVRYCDKVNPKLTQNLKTVFLSL